MQSLGILEIYIYVVVNGRTKKVMMHRYHQVSHQAAEALYSEFKLANHTIPQVEMGAKWIPQAHYL